jgi:hypothetical protein
VSAVSVVSELFICATTTASVVTTGGHRLCGLVGRVIVKRVE